MFKNYLKISIRNILKYKSFSIINIAGLVIGLACTLFILLWVVDEISYDRFYENADQLYRVAFTYRPMSLSRYFQPGALSGQLSSEYPEITRSVFVQSFTQKLSFGHDGYFEQGMRVEPDFLKMFTFPFIEGDKNTAFSDPNSIIITRSLARKIFGETNPIGQSVMINNSTRVKVSGIMEDIPHNTQFDFDFLTPIRPDDAVLKDWGAKSGTVYVQLRPGTDYRAVSSKIAGIIDEINPHWQNTLFLQPLIKDHLYPVSGQGAIIYVYVFSSIALIILLIACINFMNLSTARAEKRLKEIGIRKVVGSKRIQLIGQFLAESLVSCMAAMVLAVLLVEFLLPYINNMLNFYLQFTLNAKVVTGLLILALITGLLAGSYPAFFLSSLHPQKVLISTHNKTGRHAAIRKGLVTFQFSLSILFIIGVLIIHRQLNFVKHKDLGFNKDQIILLETRGELRDKTDTVKRQLLAQDHITDVTASANNLLFWTNSGPLTWEGMPEKTMIEFGYNFVDEDFLNTLQMKMVQGRFFSESYATDGEQAFVMNETGVKAMGLTDPVGKSVTAWFGRKGRIIGVVQDYHTATLHNAVMPCVLIPAHQGNYLCIRIKPDHISESIQTIQNTVKAIVPDDPVQYSFLDETINRMYSLDQRTHMLVLLSAGLAIFISCLGLFGLAYFTLERRVKEIGIRKVLGASIPGIVLLISTDFTKWVLLANLIAWPAAWILTNKWLQNFAYRAEINVTSFIIAGLLAFLVALLTISWQAIRAATANPVKALRYE
jgi:putative ABC transport system permease protein